MWLKTAEANTSLPAQIMKRWGEFTSSRERERERESRSMSSYVCDNGREVEKRRVR